MLAEPPCRFKIEATSTGMARGQTHRWMQSYRVSFTPRCISVTSMDQRSVGIVIDPVDRGGDRSTSSLAHHRNSGPTVCSFQEFRLGSAVPSVYPRAKGSQRDAAKTFPGRRGAPLARRKSSFARRKSRGRATAPPLHRMVLSNDRSSVVAVTTPLDRTMYRKVIHLHRSLG